MQLQVAIMLEIIGLLSPTLKGFFLEILEILKSIPVLLVNLNRYPFFKGLTSVNPTTNFKMINRWQRQIKAQLRESKIFHKLVPVVNSEGLPSYWTMEYTAYQQVG